MMINYLRRLFTATLVNEEGNSATEYAIMVALILVLCIAAVLSTGDVQQAIWFNTADRVETIVPTNN